MAGTRGSRTRPSALSTTTIGKSEGYPKSSTAATMSSSSTPSSPSAPTGGSAVFASSPITRENVISPSKMRQRSRRASSKSSLLASSRGKAPPSPSPSPRGSSRSSNKIAPHPRDSRDDDNNSRPRTPRSTRIATSPRTSSRKSRSSSSSGVVPSPRLPSAAPTPRRKNTGDNENQNVESQSVAAAAAAALLPDSPRTNSTKKLLANLRTPDPSLADLLCVLTDFDSTSHLRRVNACGAIKTLTLHKANQIPLARTRGVVTSITSVLCAVNATEEERTRCINALMHLCVPEENWKLVYIFPQTPEALARNMADKYPQIRYAACLATSFLAKKNRREVVKNRLLMYAMARVLEVNKNGALERMSVQDKKVFVGARLCVLKMLLHLSKNKDVSAALARMECVMSSLVNVANTMELAANILCIAILTNLTRLPDNAYHLVYKVPDLVGTFVRHVELPDVECAKCALYAMQNLSCASNCRQELANTPDLLGNVTKAAFRHESPEQQLSALHTLKNLSDDPFNLVTMTNTPGCTATLLALANNDASGIGGGGNKNKKQKKENASNAMAQYLACDTLATLSHWLLTLSATRKGGDTGGLDIGRRTFKQCQWEAWN